MYDVKEFREWAQSAGGIRQKEGGSKDVRGKERQEIDLQARLKF